jgi:hypothetical protein
VIAPEIATTARVILSQLIHPRSNKTFGPDSRIRLVGKLPPESAGVSHIDEQTGTTDVQRQRHGLWRTSRPLRMNREPAMRTPWAAGIFTTAAWVGRWIDSDRVPQRPLSECGASSTTELLTITEVTTSLRRTRRPPCQ